MRQYLEKFLVDFEYPREDAETLLSAYDKIIGDEETAKLLDEILSTYEKDEMCDFSKLLQKSQKIAN